MQKLNYYIDRFYTWLRVAFQNKEAETINHFNPLTPTEDAEECEVYLESIEWALKKKKTIRNIAISGTYGSGKSSIIKTFIKRIHKSENFLKRIFKPTYQFLNISLATFKDTEIQQPQPDRNNATNDKELLRLIELSILQQLFFHEKNHKTPDSRFKKIKKESTWKLVLYTCLTLLSLLSILYLFFPKIFHTISIISSIKVDSIVVSHIASSIIIISVFLLILKSSRGLLSASIKKLNINNAEIEIDNGISKSILNNHLDEIIYFFEATKYNVVIIEDLDRFEQTEVFTKLREINLLINNSNKIKRDVVFIYAIKDDMFVDKDRAKFFDFMIPIIPVVDYSNSGNKLLKIIQQNNYNISHDLIDDLSLFIDDMRLLYNIMNEFYIYSNKLGQRFQNQLLAMIVYKNIFPNDFTKLSQNEGDLYNVISKKQDYIKASIADIDREISIKRENIIVRNEQKLRNIKELRALYILALINDIKASGFLGFNVGGNIVDNDVMYEDENFQVILKGSINYFHKDHYSSKTEKKHSFTFKNIESKVDSIYTYKQREELLDKDGINELRNKIKQLTKKKNDIQKSKIKDLLSNKQIIIEIESEKNDSETKKKNDLINILLRNGYINEDYSDYISIFHEGALTKSDYQFLINVKKEETTEYSYGIIKKEGLLKKVDDFAFEKPYVFNHGLIDFLLKTKSYEKKKEFLLKQLSNETSESIGFINEYIDNSAVVELFIKSLCHQWTNIWNYIRYKSQYTDERIDKYFRLIISHADVDDIEKIFEKEYDYLTNYSDFLNISLVKKGKLEQIIKRLNLKFRSIDIDSPKPLLEYLFKNDYYDINVEMFRTLMSFNNDFEANGFETANYGYILSKGNDYQIKYIESNIDEYVEFVYLKLVNNTKEKLIDYKRLLNHSKLNLYLAEEIIVKVETYIENISEIDDKEVIDLLFKYSRVKASWDNILHSFESQDNTFSNGLIEYFNTLSNAELLSKERMTTVKVGEKSKYSALCRTIIYEQKIQSTSYKLLLKSSPWWYEEFDSEKLSKDRIAILIESGKVNPTISSYQFLKSNFVGTNVLLLEKYMEIFDEKINEITIDSSDLNLVLKSTKLSAKYKFYILNSCEEDIVIEETENLRLIAQLLVDNESYSISDSLKLSVITEKSIFPKNRLILFNRNINLIKKDMLEDFLTSMGGAYEEITNTSKKAILVDNTLNRELLKNLIKLAYISTYSEKEKGLRVNHKRRE
jgi:hypothetical protein